MFKQKDFSDEIYQHMEKRLVSNQVEDIHGLNKLAKATDLLNTAATIFEQAGMYEESDEIIKILQDFAKGLK